MSVSSDVFSEQGVSNLIKKYPVLPHNEQLKLVIDWQENSNKDSLDKLVYSNLRIVSREAWRFSKINKKISYEDLVQEGVLGILRAADKFDKTKGCTFFTYAYQWVKAMIMKSVMDGKSIVAMGRTREDRRIFGGITKSRIKAESRGLLGDDVDDFICNDLGVSKSGLHKMMLALKGGDESLNSPLKNDDDSVEIQDTLRNPITLESKIELSQLKNIATDKVREISKSFSNVERQILESRIFSEEPMTLREVSESLKISHEWVRQTEARLLNSIRKALARELNIRSINDIF